MELAIALGLYGVVLGLALVGWQLSRAVTVLEALLDDHQDHRDATEDRNNRASGDGGIIFTPAETTEPTSEKDA